MVEFFLLPSVVDIRVAETGAQLFLVNSVGQIVLQAVLTDLQNSINVANLNNGVYFARVQYNNGEAKTTRLVVAH
jgi:Secretion system C-terminal sorting domain